MRTPNRCGRRPHGPDGETVGGSTVAVDWLLRADWPESDYVRIGVGQRDDCRCARGDPRAESAGSDSDRADNYGSHYTKLT
jgi:hypothetical protein